ncbi:MAG: hypothetical protein WAV21_01065 [Minisyncoccia bacterium]
MEKRFYATPDLAFTSVLLFGICGLGYILISLTTGTFLKIIVPAIIFFVFLGFLWIALTKGTYIAVDEHKVKGRVVFLFGRTSLLSKIEALKKRDSLGGLVTNIDLVYKDKGNKLTERGLTSKEMLKKEDLTELIQLLKSKNPNIEIPSNLTQ